MRSHWSMCYLLTLWVVLLVTSGAHAACRVDNYFDRAFRSAKLTATDGLCPARNDTTAIYNPFRPSTESVFFISHFNFDGIRFNNPFCLAFTASTNNGNTAPLFSTTQTGFTAILELVITDTNLTLTLQDSSVTFPGTQFANGVMQRIQICVGDNGRANLYLNCINVATATFNSVPVVDSFIFLTIGNIFQTRYSDAIFDGRVQQLYVAQCDSDISQQTVANVQCSALPGGSPNECAQPTRSIEHLFSTNQIKTKLVLPEERTTGQGCIQEGRTVTYQCTVPDPLDPPVASTVWHGTAFNCPSTTDKSNDSITLSHSEFVRSNGTRGDCGGLSAKSVRVIGRSYTSSVTLTATAELNGATIECSLNGTTKIGTDIIKVQGGPPLPPTNVRIDIPSKTLHWTPPPDTSRVGTYFINPMSCGDVGSYFVNGDQNSTSSQNWFLSSNCRFEIIAISDCGIRSEPVTLSVADSVTDCPPPPNITNGVIKYYGGDRIPDYTLGTRARYSCNEGFFLNTTVGDEFRTCVYDENSNGVFDGLPPTCVPIQCPLLAPLDNGVITYSSDKTANYELGTIATYTCNSGFILDTSAAGSSATRTCIDDNDNDAEGVFDREAPICVPTQCQPLPGIDSGVINYFPDFTPNYNIGTVAIYKCNDDYGFTSLGSVNIRVCGDDGTFSGQAPSCVLQRCDDLPPIAGGIIAYSQDKVNKRRPVGSVAVHTCTEEGLSLTGNSMRTCENGEWTGSGPTCDKNTKSCS